MSTWTRFEKEAKVNSEMAHWQTPLTDLHPEQCFGSVQLFGLQAHHQLSLQECSPFLYPYSKLQQRQTKSLFRVDGLRTTDN